MTHSISLPVALATLGWQPFFQQQLSLDEWEHYTAARVVAQHRSRLELVTQQGERSLSIIANMPIMTVGDWVLLDNNGQFHRALERLSLFSRKAAGSKVGMQLIAANVDTVFVVCSLNHNFNLNRIERYLALANEADVEPVVVLTKADLCDDPQVYSQQVQALAPLLMVATVNSLDPASVAQLAPWCRHTKTVAFMGSSGVGKSTLINSLLGQEIQLTGAIREDDSKGGHTTTSRTLHRIPDGGLLLDTPGMRELQLADCEAGIENTFIDISERALQCRYANCQHEGEPGCAIQAAIAAGELDERRLFSYHKLKREQAQNSATLAEKRARGRDLSRLYRRVQTASRKRKKT